MQIGRFLLIVYADTVISIANVKPETTESTAIITISSFIINRYITTFSFRASAQDVVIFSAFHKT